MCYAILLVLCLLAFAYLIAAVAVGFLGLLIIVGLAYFFVALVVAISSAKPTEDQHYYEP
jgi:hypothetical protein